MFDVRFLPNPHYEPELRPLTGLDDRIVEFINLDGSLDAFYARLFPFLIICCRSTLPRARRTW